METMTIYIPVGFALREKTCAVDISEAEEILSTKRQHRYTRAHRYGDTAILTQHALLCPWCGYTIPAYDRFFSEHHSARTPKAIIREWASHQLSLFDRDVALEFNEPINSSDNLIICPKCGASASLSNKKREVTITSDSGILTITAEVFCEEIICDAKALDVSLATSSNPISESLTFDLNMGKIFFSYNNSIEKEVTNHPELVVNTVVGKLANESRPIKKEIIRFFKSYYGGELPFIKAEIDLMKIFEMTRFVGFPRAFYGAIPYTTGTWSIDESFAETVNVLHSSDPIKLAAYYIATGLPRSKRITRLFGLHPDLLFYAEEAKSLWKIFHNHDFFYRLLSDKNVYLIVSYLHCFPALTSLYSDFAVKKGIKSLFNQLTKNLFVFNDYGTKYAAMNIAFRKMQQGLWGSNFCFDISFCRSFADDCEDAPPNQDTIYHSFPIFIDTLENHKSTCVNGYLFKPLVSRNDFLFASKALNNCLGNWNQWMNRVIGIYLNGTPVGAIEVFCKHVVSANIQDNEDIEYDNGVFKAYQMWRQLYKFRD